MRWIGQHIWDLISRFRGDVYLDKVSTDPVESSPDNNLAIKDGKIVRASGTGGGGGSITVKTDGDGDGNLSTVSSSVTELIFYGNDEHVKIIDNGNGSIIVDHHESINFSPNFSITTNPVAGFGNYWIGNPTSKSGLNFVDGGWGNSTNRKATDSSTITFSSNTCGNWLINGNASKLKVTIYGQTSTNTSDTNVLATHELQVTANTSSPHSQGNNGITIQVLSFGEDGTSDKKKCRVSVAIELDHSSIINTSGNYTGSQKYSKIKIEQVAHDGSSISGVSAFESDPFFYDNTTIKPIASNPTFTFSSSTTKQLSNIGYYDTATWTSDSSNHQNLTRDTGNNGRGAVLLTPSHDTLGLTSFSKDLTGDSGDTDDNTNEQEDGTHTMSTLSYPIINFTQGIKLKVKGGLSGDSDYTNVVGDAQARNFNNINPNATALSEDHKGEVYRISDDRLASITGLSTAQTMSEATWKTHCVAHDPDNFSVIGLSLSRGHLIQGYFNDKWGLFHPTDVSGLSAYPTATELGWSSGTPFTDGTSKSGMYEYYRFFRTTGSATSDWSIDIDGLNKSTFETQTANGNLSIKFLAPGNNTQQTNGVNNQGTWIPLSVNHSSGNNNGCWANAVAQSNSSEQYDLAFNMGTTVLIIEISMKAAFPASTIGAITMQTGHLNG